MLNLEFIGKKARDKDSPYAEFTGFMFGGPATWKVLKKYANDDSKQYARWFMVVTTVATGNLGDMGDTYVSDVLSGADHLVRVDGREPTEAEQTQVTELLRAIQKDPAPDFLI